MEITSAASRPPLPSPSQQGPSASRVPRTLTAARRRADPEAGADWRDRAHCRGQDPELFFPIGATGPALVQAADAKAVCLACAVQKQCLSWAVRAGVEHGVWGGETEQERVSMRRRAYRRRATIRTAGSSEEPT